MGLRVKNYNIFGVHWKMWLLGEWILKNQYRGDGCLKRGVWAVCRFKGGLARKSGCFCLILLFYALKEMWMICFDVLLCLFDVKRNSHCNIYWNFVLVKLLLAYGSILVLQIACLSLSLKIKVIYLWCDKIIKLKFFVWFIHSSKNGH